MVFSTSAFPSFMDKFIFTTLLILVAALDGARGDAMVTGSVFCDQCKDGYLSLFDYPVSGVKVTVTCTNNGQIAMTREETTNMFGNFGMRFDGTPNLSNCHAQVSGNSQQKAGCAAASGPAQNLTLTFRMFDMEYYAVNALLTQPTQPMSFCPKSTTPVPAPVMPALPPSHAPTTPRSPAFRLPPMPPMPLVEASACPHQIWTMPEYNCYWRTMNPETKVAVAFGPIAARRYGTDMTLWQGLQGRGDPYRTLLREGTTALLNSYNSLQFSYNAIGVVTHMNLALMGSTRNVLHTAIRFMKANSGAGNVPCKLTACK